jgi:HK97 gp10 family phage protein
MLTSEKLAAAIPETAAVTSRGVAAALLLVQRRAKLICTEKGIVDTGFLRANITPQMTGEFEGVVESHADYSIYNEFGTIYMAARPYMRPALDEEKTNIEHCIGQPVIKVLEVSIFV